MDDHFAVFIETSVDTIPRSVFNLFSAETELFRARFINTTAPDIRTASVSLSSIRRISTAWIVFMCSEIIEYVNRFHISQNDFNTMGVDMSIISSPIIATAYHLSLKTLDGSSERKHDMIFEHNIDRQIIYAVVNNVSGAPGLYHF